MTINISRTSSLVVVVDPGGDIYLTAAQAFALANALQAAASDICMYPSYRKSKFLNVDLEHVPGSFPPFEI
jgi:hypothetical protein